MILLAHLMRNNSQVGLNALRANGEIVMNVCGVCLCQPPSPMTKKLGRGGHIGKGKSRSGERWTISVLEGAYGKFHPLSLGFGAIQKERGLRVIWPSEEA